MTPSMEALQAQHDYESIDALEVSDSYGVMDAGCSLVRCIECHDEDDCTALFLCDACGQSVCGNCQEKHEDDCEVGERG